MGAPFPAIQEGWLEPPEKRTPSFVMLLVPAEGHVMGTAVAGFAELWHVLGESAMSKGSRACSG